MQVVFHAGPGTAVFYVNNLEVGHTPYDFSVSCGRIPAKLKEEEFAAAKVSGRLPLEASVQLVIPPNLLPGFIKALTVQKELYEKRFAPINDPSEANHTERAREH